MAKEVQRTAEELKNPDFNYFLAFGIELNEKDVAKISDAIKTEKSKWSRGTTPVQSRLMVLIPDIEAIMYNDATFDGDKYVPNSGARTKEADAAKKFKLKEAVDLIQILCQTRKSILKSDILSIYNKANKPVVYFSEDELFQAIAYLKQLGITIVDNTDKNAIRFDELATIEKLLQTPGKKDLYDFLGVDSRASNAEIEAASSKRYSEDRNKSKAIFEATKNLKPLVTKYLINNRTVYDQYLLLHTKVWDEFAKRSNLGLEQLQMEEYQAYVQIVIDYLKVPIEEAERIIGLGCNFYHFTIVGKADSSSFEFCPFPDCGKLFVKGAKSCPHCGKSIEVICWNCKQQTRITKEDKGCGTCGATNHAHELFILRCQKIDQLLSRPTVEISELQSAFLEVKNVVPNYASRADSTVAKKAKEYEAIIAQRVKQEETIGAKYKEEVSKIQQLIAKHCYQAALAIAKSLPVKYNSYNIDNSRKLVSDISAVMQTAQRHVDLAKQYMAQGNANQAIASAAKAIDICDDFTDARQIMQKYPPKAVTNLRITVEKDKARLEWEDALKQDFVSYTIIKKIGIAPTSPEDGALVDSGLSVRFFEDANIVSATPYYYAVFAERYGVRSSIAVTTSPATIYADVINMQQEVVDGGVKVVWETPQNVKSIEVWRNSGTVAPLRAGEGTRIEASVSGFSDNKCNGENAYLVICNYDVKGKTIQSKGVRAVFKPYEKTTPLEGVKIEPIGGNRYTFSCAPGYVGKVKLYFANTKLGIPFNSTLKYLDFNAICKGLTPLETVLNANGELTFSLTVGKIYQIYPIVSTEQLFIVSPPHLINTIEGISKCTHSVSAGTVSVSGTLHPQAQAIIAKVSNDKYIDRIDGGGEKFSFKAEDFRKNNKLEIKLKTNTVNYITLFVEFKDDGVVSYSPLIKLDPPIDYREAVSVLFSMNYTVSPVKPFKLTLCFEADSAIEIPKLLLMQGSPRPMNKNAGKLCERIEGIVLKKGLFSKRYTAKKVITVDPTSTSTKFALFLNEETSRVQMKEVRKL